MTIDEAIKHCREVAEEKENEAEFGFGNAFIDRSSCLKCAEEHRQLVKWLEELKALKEQPSGDCISRKAVMNIDFNRICATYAKPNEMIRQKIAELPSATPQPKTEQQQQKTGHWIHDGGYWKNRWICSECGYKLFYEQTRVCPDCGCLMEGENK